MGARAIGLAGSTTALRGEAESVLWNPAGIAGLDHRELFYIRSDDFGTTAQVFGLVTPLGMGQFGIAYYDLAVGQIDARDALNNDIGVLDISNQILILTAAVPLGPLADVGITYKLVRFESACAGACTEFGLSSTSHVFDVGAVAPLPVLPGLTVGAVLRNLGSSVALEQGGPSDPLPTRVRLGASYVLMDGVPLGQRDLGGPSVRILGDVQQTWSEFDDMQGSVAAEVGFRGLLYVRGGYAWAGEARSGATLGVGLRVDRLILDFGHIFDDFADFDDGTPLQFRVGLEF
ncbi:MAG: hypothetical protein V3T24_13225 [Longimicrobiales bacterium]